MKDSLSYLDDLSVFTKVLRTRYNFRSILRQLLFQVSFQVKKKTLIEVIER